jgi:hypothetical protein
VIGVIGRRIRKQKLSEREVEWLWGMTVKAKILELSTRTG